MGAHFPGRTTVSSPGTVTSVTASVSHVVLFRVIATHRIVPAVLVSTTITTVAAAAVRILLLLLLSVRAVPVSASAGALVPAVILPERPRCKRLLLVSTNLLFLRIILRVSHDRLRLFKNFQRADDWHHLLAEDVVHHVQDAHNGILFQLVCFEKTENARGQSLPTTHRARRRDHARAQKEREREK